MEIKLKLFVLLFGILFTGLTAGLCFTWSNAITPGIGRLDDYGFLSSFQAMNRAIVNKTFLLVFFGPVVLLFYNTYLFKGSTMGFWCILTAALLFFGGVGVVTIFGNVPLNEMLDGVDLDQLSTQELTKLRAKFERPWNELHTIRTITATVSFALLLMGLVLAK